MKTIFLSITGWLFIFVTSAFAQDKMAGVSYNTALPLGKIQIT